MAAERSWRIIIISLTSLMLLAGAGCALVPVDTDSRMEETGGGKPGLSEKGAGSSEQGEAGKAPFRPAGNAESYYFYMQAQIYKKRGNLGRAVKYLESALEADPGELTLQKELAVLYLHRKEYEKSLGLVEKMLKTRPRSPDILSLKASIRRTLYPNADVSETYEKVLSIDPERRQVYKILGRLYMDQGEHERAGKVFQRMVEHFPGSYFGHFYLGRIHAGQGSYKKAESSFKKAIELAPSSNRPRWELVRLYKKNSEYQKAISVYKGILEQNPDDSAAAIELSLAYLKYYRTREARELLAELGRRSRNDAGVVRTLMQRLVLEKRYDEALAAIKGMLEGAPDSPGLHYAEGVVHYNLENYSKAMNALQKVEQESPFYFNAAIHQAVTAYEQQDLETATSILESALDRVDKPEQIEIIPYLSAFYQEKGELSEAEKLLRRGIEMEPDNPELHFELGVLNEKQDRSDEAIEQMKKVLKLDPEHADALNFLGYTYADKGILLDKAEELIKKALQKKPESGYIIDSLGWVYYKKGMFEEAAVYIKKAASLIPDDPVVLEHLGDVNAKLGNTEKALESYRQALEKKAENPSAIEKKIEALRKSGP